VDAKGGRWFPMFREMTNHQTGHRTTLNVLKLETNVPTPDDLFTTRAIERN
jgi:outer membrane lipoprotein-sorting protein